MLHSFFEGVGGGEGTESGSTSNSNSEVPDTLKQKVLSEYERIVSEKEEKYDEEIKKAWRENQEIIRAQTTEHNQRLRGEAVRVARSPDISIPAPSSPVGKTKKKTIVITIPPVAPRPPLFTWTSVRKSVKVDDEEALHNFPHIDDDDEEFLDDLLEAYDGKLHAAEDEEDSNLMDDELLVDLVKSVLPKETTDGDKTEPRIPALSADTDEGVKVTPTTVFQAISEVYPDKGSAEDLKNSYTNVFERKEQEARAVENRFPNMDGPDAKSLPRDKILNSYRSLFCRRCFTYDCMLHTWNEDQLPFEPVVKEKLDEFKPIKPCGSKCFLHLAEAKEQAEMDAGASGAQGRQDNNIPKRNVKAWSAAEQSLFTVANPMYKSNYCATATMIMTKTCQEVYYFAKEAANKTGDGVDVEKPGPLLNKPRKHQSFKKKLYNLHRQQTKKDEAYQRKEKDDGDGEREATHYTPCDHPGQACEENCPCFSGSNYCEKFCRCAPDCPNIFPGCRCKKHCNTKQCPCFVAHRECDPEKCKNCSSDEPDISKINCKNVNIQRGFHKHLLSAESDVAGWGVFVKGGAKKDEFLQEYTGEVITQAEADRRGKLYDKTKCSFLFNLNSEFVIDSTRKGSKIRFVNHSDDPNCYAKVLMVNGDHRIGVFAKREVKDGEELLLDYRYGPTEKLKYVGAQPSHSRRKRARATTKSQ